MNAPRALVAKIRYFLVFADKRILAVFVGLFCLFVLVVGIGVVSVLNRDINTPLSPLVDKLIPEATSTHKTGTTNSANQAAQNKTTQNGPTAGSNNNSRTANTNSAQGTSTGGATSGGTGVTTPTPPPPAPPAHSTYFGASPANPGGESSTAAQSVITKWGSGASIRQFFSSDLTKGPYHPSGASVVHSSYKPDIASVLNGSLDAQIAALIQRTPAGDILEFYHEPDNDGLNAAGITDMIAAKNHLYDLKQQVKPSVLVAATMTGGFFANYTSESTRVPWYGLKGDLVGLDADGVHDTSGPTYDMTYADEISGVKTFMTRNTTWTGWTVPEHGTSRQPWDTTGSARASWFSAQIQLFISGGAYAVMLYDYNTSSHNTATNYNQIYAGTPEFTVWSAAVSGNP